MKKGLDNGHLRVYNTIMMYFHGNNRWLTERCLACGSVNHILLANTEAHAWECWNCLEVWWIDELAKDMLIISYDIDDDEANNMLVNYHPYILYLYGHMEPR